VIQRATRSVYVVFILAGVVISSFLSRVPQIRDLLELKPGPLGRLLLMTAIGSLISLPLSGLIVHRLGAARTVTVMAFVGMTGLSIAAIGTEISAIVVGAGLLFFGFGAGAWDVGMNVEAAAVEQVLERSIMSRFHAAFSIGTVAGALGGAAMNALDVAPIAHLLVVAVGVLLAVPVMCRGFMPAGADDHEAKPGDRSPLVAWTERRTVLIGLFVLCMTFAEGTGNDWLGVASIDGYGTSDALGSVAYVVFVVAMTTGRWFGPHALDRFGRVRVLRAGAACAFVGVLVVVYGPAFGTALAGIVLWGLGTALGFPTGMSAAADDPQHSAGRVSVVATVGYVAFLAGPSLIGVIGDHTGVLRALTLTAAILGIGFLVAGATKPLVLTSGPADPDPVGPSSRT
jgi:predicted MFS family arabinose efflux permease